MNPERVRSIARKAAIGAGGIALLGVAGMGGEKLASEHGDEVSAILRQTIGTDATIWLEGKYFLLKDYKNSVKDSAFGIGKIENQFGETNEIIKNIERVPLEATVSPSQEEAYAIPTETPTPEPPKPTPLVIPEVKLIQQPIPGEGIWTTDGLPHSTPDNPLMAKTIIRPDIQRPRSQVGILLVDKRRANLHMVAGIDSPSWEYGIVGPGKIAENDLPNLMASWVGGFLGPDGNFGMYADGKVYRPLINGFACIATTSNGEILMGEWGRTLNWQDNITAVRQNAKLLVEDGEVTELAKNQEGNTSIWGRLLKEDTVNFITWRTAIGLTNEGNLIVAAGNDLSPKTLAMGLQAAGARTAMQLDINTPQALITIFDHKTNGVITGSKLMKEMTETNPSRYLISGQKNDFMYLTYNEDRYK